VERVEAGSRLVADAGQTMSEIVGSVQRVSDIIGEITAAAGEQSDGIAQVNTAVSQLDQMTQQNAALVEQSAAAAQSLREQAARLAETVQVFRLNGVALPTSSAPALKLEPVLAKPVAASLPKPAEVVSSVTKSAAPVVKRSAPAPAPLLRPTPSGAAASDEADWESF
jgi:uncharacterized phage infection (PIP) family protein YhgE